MESAEDRQRRHDDLKRRFQEARLARLPLTRRSGGWTAMAIGPPTPPPALDRAIRNLIEVCRVASNGTVLGRVNLRERLTVAMAEPTEPTEFRFLSLPKLGKIVHLDGPLEPPTDRPGITKDGRVTCQSYISNLVILRSGIVFR